MTPRNYIFLEGHNVFNGIEKKIKKERERENKKNTKAKVVVLK